MLYMFMLYYDDSNPPPAEALSAVIGAHNALGQQARQSNTYVWSEAVGNRASAKTVRVNNGNTLTTDGPFIESKELMGGFYILDCKDLDEALGIAAQFPEATYGAVEVRPVMLIPGSDYGTRAGDRVRQPIG